MSKRKRRARVRDAFETIDPRVLDSVGGGRITPRTQLDPVILQSVQELAKAIQSVGQNMASAKQGSSQMMMQMMQSLMGGGKGK
jgi:hypothetical protein